MGFLVTFTMYALWILTILALLAATFTSYQYEDLNLIAVVLLVFASVNSFFVASKGKKPSASNHNT